MIETLSFLPVATASTRSRRGDVLHRATPVLLPKQKKKPTLQDPPQRLTRPKSPRMPSPQETQPLPTAQQPLQTAFFTSSAPQSTLDNASSLIRHKRKANLSFLNDDENCANSDATRKAIDGNGHSTKIACDDDPDTASLTRKRQRLSVELEVSPAAPADTFTAKTPPVSQNQFMHLLSIPQQQLLASAASQQHTGIIPPTSTTSTRNLQPSSSTSGTVTSRRNIGRLSSKNSPQLEGERRVEKAINGFKQELKGLQVTPATIAAVATGSSAVTGGRQLRSQQATRFKSELSAYFPEYDEVIGNEPKEKHLLDIDTPILLLGANGGRFSNVAAPAMEAPAGVVRGYSDSLFSDLFDAHVIDFVGNQHLYVQAGSRANAPDPLPDSMFEPHHKRAERAERTIRNSEKGRAQHEKDQIIRLLEGLRGPDWLRTMGVSGITESRKKSFEPARVHFIKGCRTILNKFRLWSLEEKRLKLEKGRAHAEELRAAAQEEAVAAASASAHYAKARSEKAKTKTSSQPSGKKRRGSSNTSRRHRGHAGLHQNCDDADTVLEMGGDKMEFSGGSGVDECEDIAAGHDDLNEEEQPDSSDVDAVIAKQLRAEALARSRLAAKGTTSHPPNNRLKKQAQQPDKLKKVQKPQRRRHNLPATDGSIQNPGIKDAPLNDPVVSFFRKRYQRDAALSRGRRKGRTVMAWGQPVPELPEAEFGLPGDMLLGEPEMIKATKGGRPVKKANATDEASAVPVTRYKRRAKQGRT